MDHACEGDWPASWCSVWDGSVVLHWSSGVDPSNSPLIVEALRSLNRCELIIWNVADLTEFRCY